MNAGRSGPEVHCGREPALPLQIPAPVLSVSLLSVGPRHARFLGTLLDLNSAVGAVPALHGVVSVEEPADDGLRLVAVVERISPCVF